MNKIKNILVTGGAGFIGSNFLNIFVKEHPEINFINFDLLVKDVGSRDKLNIEDHSNYRFFQGNICNLEDIHNSYKLYPFDAIINFAAESHVDKSIENPLPFGQTNIIGTLNLLQFATINSIVRYHQVSTDEVYGSLGKNNYFTEDSPINPSSPYSASKAAADLLVESYGVTFNLDYLITRCSNNYGPNQNDPSFIPVIIRNALADQPIPIYGDGSNIRDWIFVEDHCRGIWKVFWDGRSKNVYNLGARQEYDNLYLAKQILTLLNKPDDLIEFVEDRPGHDFRYAIDPSKANNLGWKHKTSIEDGLQRTIDFYVQMYSRKPETN